MSEILPTKENLQDPYVLQLIEALSRQQDEIERLESSLEYNVNALDKADRQIRKLQSETRLLLKGITELESELVSKHEHLLQVQRFNDEIFTDNECLRAGINRAGQLALQKAGHETIRQVLAEALEVCNAD